MELRNILRTNREGNPYTDIRLFGLDTINREDQNSATLGLSIGAVEQGGIRNLVSLLNAGNEYLLNTRNLSLSAGIQRSQSFGIVDLVTKQLVSFYPDIDWMGTTGYLSYQLHPALITCLLDRSISEAASWRALNTSTYLSGESVLSSASIRLALVSSSVLHNTPFVEKVLGNNYEEQKLQTWCLRDNPEPLSITETRGAKILLRIAQQLRDHFEQGTGSSWDSIADQLREIHILETERFGQSVQVTTRLTHQQLGIFHRLNLPLPAIRIAGVEHTRQPEGAAPNCRIMQRANLLDWFPATASG